LYNVHTNPAELNSQNSLSELDTKFEDKNNKKQNKKNNNMDFIASNIIPRATLQYLPRSENDKQIKGRTHG